MRKLAVAFAVGFLLFLTSPPVGAQGTFSLEYKIVKSFSYDDPLIYMASQYLQRSPGVPADIKGTPKDAKGDLSYYTGSLGARSFVVVMDSATPPNAYVDRNGDGQLSDEKPLKRTKASLPWNSADSAMYGPVAVPVGKDGASVRVLLARRDDDAMTVWPAGYLTGQVKLADKTYKIALVDADFDGRFEPAADIAAAAARRSSDTLAIDLNADGKFESDPNERGEIQPLTPMINLADAYYKVKMAPDGSSLELVKAEPKMGTLAVKGANVELLLLGDSGVQCLKGPKTSWPLPEGRYFCQSISLVRADDAKSKWILRTSGKTGQLQGFEIKPDKTMTVEVGGPLTVNADVQQAVSGWVFKGTEVSIGFVIVGKGGEEYSPAAIKDGVQVPAPKLTIYDKDGKVLASGSFAYG